MFYRYSKWLGIALLGILILLTFGVYFKVLRAEFVYDDFGFIVNNKDIQSFKPFSKFFLSPDIFTGSSYAAENVGGKNWRPISSLAFAIEYRLFGPNPFGFHLISILLHLINIVLVYLLIAKITSRKGIALATASLWALHPTLTEAVSWISNQSSLIFFGFFLIAILALLKERFWISYLFFGLSLLSKETALGGIFIIPFVFLIDSEWREKINFRKVLINSYPFVLISLAYFYAHYKILGALGDHALRGSFFQNLFLAPAVFYKYVGLAFYPVGLLLDYSNFLLPSGAGDPRVIAGALLVVFLAALVYLGFSAKGGKSHSDISLGIIWFMAFLLPVLQFIPFQDIMGERFLYAPLVGFFLAVILGFERFSNYAKSKFNFNLSAAGKIIFVLVLFIFFILTSNRNKDWLNSENLWKSVLRIDSKNEKALSNLGGYYVNTGQVQKVIEFSERLLKINPEHISGNLNLGAGLAMAGRFGEAESRFLYVLSKKPDYQPALVSLATFYQSIGHYDDALKIVQNLNSRYPDREDIKQRLSQLENIMKYNKSSFGADNYIEANVQSPAVEGNVVNSGIAGRIILSDGTPFEASLDVFKINDMSRPFISVRSDAQGKFQIPLKPAVYIIKPNDPDGPRAPLKDQYAAAIGDNQWLQVKIEYR
ncbi:MAG: tetratricopeptide repeat protein [Candidatus Azambacteria bacterium]|nr:tetratricopeptide repeat protein [Candidatus Azambacteria bacterium]